MNKEEIKKIVKDTIKELRDLEKTGTSKEIVDFWCGDEKKKEFPQEGDEYFYVDLGWKISSLIYGTYTADKTVECCFKSKEEAEAVRDLRKHEAKCRFTMEDFENGSFSIGNDFIVFNSGLPINAAGILGGDFPTKELAQERADILKRIAKIRNLI